jgi:hypothetical protein
MNTSHDRLKIEQSLISLEGDIRKLPDKTRKAVKDSINLLIKANTSWKVILILLPNICQTPDIKDVMDLADRYNYNNYGLPRKMVAAALGGCAMEMFNKMFGIAGAGQKQEEEVVEEAVTKRKAPVVPKKKEEVKVKKAPPKVTKTKKGGSK